jgi:hypothetical protein
LLCQLKKAMSITTHQDKIREFLDELLLDSTPGHACHVLSWTRMTGH